MNTKSFLWMIWSKLLSNKKPKGTQKMISITKLTHLLIKTGRGPRTIRKLMKSSGHIKNHERSRQKPPQKGRDNREKWCRFCSSKRHGYRRVHSHTDAQCHLKKNERDSNDKKFRHKTDYLNTIVADSQKQVNQMKQSNRRDE